MSDLFLHLARFIQLDSCCESVDWVCLSLLSLCTFLVSLRRESNCLFFSDSLIGAIE